MFNWYLVHTKIKQEKVALENLERQDYECFLPVVKVERVRRKALVIVEEPLFPRYLFIHLDDSLQSKSWGPIRSSVGVTRLVKFGLYPAKIDAEIVQSIRARVMTNDCVRPHFTPGQTVVVNTGPFAGVEAIFQCAEGKDRVLVLLQMLGKPLSLPIEPSAVSKLA